MTQYRTPDPRTVLSQDELDSARANVEQARPLTQAQLDLVSRVLSPQLRTILAQ